MDQTISDLENRVNQYSDLPNNNNKFKLLSNIKSMNMIYIAIPFIIFIVLFITKPMCIMMEVVNPDTDKTEYKVSFTQIIIWDIILSGSIIVALILHNKSKNKE